MRQRLDLARCCLALCALLGMTLPGCGGGGGASEGAGPPPGDTSGKTAKAQDDRNADTGATDPLGESVERITYLDQGWTPADSQRFYFTSQGSQVVPYTWFLNLEQADSTTPFKDGANILKYRFLPQKPDAMNPDGLPVGFVKDVGSERAWFGFNCAACHTTEIHHKGVGYRIDGGPSMGDIRGLLVSLAAALKATRDDAGKFDRFAAKVLAGADNAGARKNLKDDLARIIGRREGYNARNFPPDMVGGYARIDAFGAILNEIFYRAVNDGDSTPPTANSHPADAPVSIPFLWDTPQHDKLQWNGSATNGGLGDIGALGRNVGEVLGVFGDFDIPENPGLLGYKSTVQVQNLRRMEDWVTTLWSPRWPDALGKIDPDKRDKGRALYRKFECNKCHDDTIDRKDPNRKVMAVMRGTGTDPLMSDNFANRTWKAGKLKGAFSKYFPPIGERIPTQTLGDLALQNAVIGTIAGSLRPPPKDELTTIEIKARRGALAAFNAGAEVGPKYKARPLNGIWATAPYLHNGSVPTLYHLLKPVGERPKSFSVGTRAFDPEKVGFRTDATNVFTFRVEDKGRAIPGNSNGGHEFGANLKEEERLQLLEYLKSL